MSAPGRIEPTQIAKFAAVYAEAVLTYLDSGEVQWVTWDGVSHRFDFVSSELDTPNQLILLTVDEHWEKQIGEVAEITDPAHSQYDPEALREAIEHELTEEGVGERILKDFLRRLAQLEEDAEDEADGRSAATDSDES